MLGKKKDKPSSHYNHVSAKGRVGINDQSLIGYDPVRSPPPRAPINGGNTCYLDSILVALFAEYDGWDGLLHTSPSPSSSSSSSSSSNHHRQRQRHYQHNPKYLTHQQFTKPRSTNTTTNSADRKSSPSPRLVHNVRAIVNAMRTGNVVQPSALNLLRETLIKCAGWYAGLGQHDAAELLTVLLDALYAPFVSLVKHLSHGACPDEEADHVPYTERMIWLNFSASSPTTTSSSSSSVPSTRNGPAVPLETLIDAYFFGEVVHGLRRDVALPADYYINDENYFYQEQQQQNYSQNAVISTPTLVDAMVSRSLIPAYTPERETGEHSSVAVSRLSFAFLTVPFAVSRFNASGTSKDMRSVRVATALDASRYVGRFATPGVTYTLILRAVVCHLGISIKSGHYVTYTYAPQAGGWRRWDDLDDGLVRSVMGNVQTGEPVDQKWAAEIRRNCYLLFYELVPGDGLDELEKNRTFDDAAAAAAAHREDRQRDWRNRSHDGGYVTDDSTLSRVRTTPRERRSRTRNDQVATTRRNDDDDNWEVRNMYGVHVDETVRNNVDLQPSIDRIIAEQFQNQENMAAEMQDSYAALSGSGGIGLEIANGDTIDTGNGVMSQQVVADGYNARSSRTSDGRRQEHHHRDEGSYNYEWSRRSPENEYDEEEASTTSSSSELPCERSSDRRRTAAATSNTYTPSKTSSGHRRNNNHSDGNCTTTATSRRHTEQHQQRQQREVTPLGPPGAAPRTGGRRRTENRTGDEEYTWDYVDKYPPNNSSTKTSAGTRPRSRISLDVNRERSEVSSYDRERRKSYCEEGSRSRGRTRSGRAQQHEERLSRHTGSRTKRSSESNSHSRSSSSSSHRHHY